MALVVKPSPELSDNAFMAWKGVIEDRLGLQMPDHRRSFLKTCLSIRMREVGFDDYQAYYDYIKDSRSGQFEWYRLIDRLTIQETRFFRDPASYALVEKHLQTLVRNIDRPLNLWSVGCSTGEEAYSLAMLSEEVIKASSNGTTLKYGVTGTDISKHALNCASTGIYGARRVAMVEDALLERYFQPCGYEYKVIDRIRERMCFARLNLMELANSPLKNVDVIYCQNVLIYFRKWRRKDIVTELVKRLSPGGILVLGMGELIDFSSPDLLRIPSENALAYLKL